MKLQITLKEIESDKFFTKQEAHDCYVWLKDRVLVAHPKDNTHDKLLEYVQLYKEMVFQST